MKRLGLFAILFAFMLLALPVQAADLQVFVSCIERTDEAHIVHFGYEASDDAGENPTVGYIGNVYVESSAIEAGRHEDAAVVTLTYGQQAEFSVNAWFSGEDESTYSEVWASWDTTAPSCTTPDTSGSEPPTLDDLGNANDPRVNDRANACYAPGQQCQTQAEWEAGWYLIRQQ